MTNVIIKKKKANNMEKNINEEELVKDLHHQLKEIICNIKTDQKKIRSLNKKTESIASVLHSALDDALNHLDGAIANIEEELNT